MAAAVLLLLMVTALPSPAHATSAAATIPVGMPYENYAVPWSRAADTRRWREASRAGSAELAQELARVMVERRLSAGNPVALAEAYFALGLSHDAAGRHSQAEDAFLAARQSIMPLVTAAPAGQSRTARRQRQLAERWAPYIDLHLRSCLAHQRRFREADGLERLIATVATGEPPERGGIGGIAGIATTIAPPPQQLARLADDLGRQTYRSLYVTAFADASVAPGRIDALRALIAFETDAFGEADAIVGIHRIDLAETLFEAGMLDAAQVEAEAGRAIGMQAADARQVARAGSVIGHTAFLQQRMDDAIAAFVAVTKGPDRLLATDAQVMLGASHYRLGHLADAERWYRSALDFDRWTPAFRRQLRAFLARIARENGDAAASVAQLQPLCRELAELVTQGARGVRSTNRLDGLAAELRRCSHAWLAGLAAPAMRGDATVAEAAAEAVQLAHLDPVVLRMARFGARVHAGRAGVGALADDLEDLIADRDEADAAPAEDWPQRSATEFDPAAAARVEALDAQIGQLSIMLAAQAPRYWDLRMPRALTRHQLLAGEGSDPPLLDPREALLAFIFPRGEDQGYVIAIGHERSAFATIPVGDVELGEMIDRLRASIDPGAYGLSGQGDPASLGETRFDHELAADLYRLLLGDADIANVVAGAETLLFVPSGPLVRLPPGLLLTDRFSAPEDGAGLRRAPWLIRSHAVAVLPSIAALRMLRRILPAERSPARQPLLSFVDPSLPGAAVMSMTGQSDMPGVRGVAQDIARLRPLPFARREGEALRSLLGAGEDWLFAGVAASKARLRFLSDTGQLADARIVQFATHGFPARPFEAGSEPALVLAGASTIEEILLPASEVAQLNLNADWVILSGCNTASTVAGEGLSGFTEAFIAAGASALLVSHWRVDDPSVARIVPRTIANAMQAGTSRAQALRLAMLELLDDPDFGAAHPAFWAPLTLVGDPR